MIKRADIKDAEVLAFLAMGFEEANRIIIFKKTL